MNLTEHSAAAHEIQEHNIRCVLFDLGLTLWTYASLAAWRDETARVSRNVAIALRDSGTADLRLDVVTEVDLQALGERIQSHFVNRVEAFEKAHNGAEPNFEEVVIDTLCDLELLTSCPRNRDLGADVYEALRPSYSVSHRLYADALPTLYSLRHRGYSLGIVTDRAWGGEAFLADLRRMGVLSVIDPCAVAVSADVGVCKPNPAIFRHALASLDMEPNQTAMVGDSLPADIGGAHSLGMFAIQKRWRPVAGRDDVPELIDWHTSNHLVKGPGAVPDVVIDDLCELCEVFQ